MRIGKTFIHSQYFWIDSNTYGRAVTSSGKKWFGWYGRTKRLNIWPFSMWFGVELNK